MFHYDIKHLLPLAQIVPEKTQKVGCVVHWTAGGSNPVATIESWNSDPARIAAHAVIGRTSTKGDTKHDGIIAQAIDTDYFAFNLGVKGENDPLKKPQGYYDKRFIGIEMCSYGPLTLKDGKFLTWVNSEVPANQVVDLGRDWRGFRYFHDLTDAQYAKLQRLIAYYASVCGFKIEKGRVFSDTDFDFDIARANTKTVTFHTNFRATGKTDFPPLPKMIAAMNALHANPEAFAV